MKKTAMFCFLCALLLAVPAGAEETLWNALDPRPYDPAVDPDVDLYMANINSRKHETVRGTMVRTELLTRLTGNDPLRPAAKGAVLTVLKSICHAFIPPRGTTTSVTLSGEQELYYVYSGHGRIICGKKTAELRDGIGLLVPPGISFSIENTGDEPLAMYIITEPIPSGFTPKTELVVRDEYGRPLTAKPGHWSHIGSERLFSAEDGLAVLTGSRPVYFAPLTMSQPHSHNETSEEIWISIKGEETRVLLGKKMRDFSAGTAYKVPPDGISPHANINVSCRTIKTLWMMISGPGEPKQYSMLDGAPFDPATDIDIDMYIRNWRESPPVTTHGALLERDVFTACDGDPLAPKTRGAVLKYTRKFSFSILLPNLTTVPVTPAGEQELFYITGGNGILSAGGSMFSLYPGVTFLVPEGIVFTLENTGVEDLTMYHIVEPVPDGFKPVDHIVWRDENLEPFHTTTAHWVNCNKWLIRAEEGLSDINLFLTVTIPPGEFAQPHSHGEGIEEVWCPLTDNAHVLLGKQVRHLQPGTAYMIPPDDRTPHANFNVSGTPLRFLYFARGWSQQSSR